MSDQQSNKTDKPDYQMRTHERSAPNTEPPRERINPNTTETPKPSTT